MLRSTILLFACCGAMGCNYGDTDLGNPEHVRTWANSASAIAVYLRVHQPIAYSYGFDEYVDPACPVRSDDGTTATVSGDCTTGGTDRVGSVTIVRSGTHRTVTFDGFGTRGEASENTITGTVEIDDLSPTSHTFVANYTQQNEGTTSVDYEGSVEGFFDTAETVWNGSGTVTLSDGDSPTGTVDATTVSERRNNTLCDNQSLSGSTSLTTGGRTATVTYDGATDCDDPGADAEWSLDGVAQGSLTGIGCSIRPTRALPPTGALLALGLALVLRRRRR